MDKDNLVDRVKAYNYAHPEENGVKEFDGLYENILVEIDDDEEMGPFFWVKNELGECVYLDKNDETGEYSIDYSHSILFCSKLNRLCDYEYHTCKKYEAGGCASTEILKGKTTYHCKYGESKWLNNTNAKKQRPEYCKRLDDIVEKMKVKVLI